LIYIICGAYGILFAVSSFLLRLPDVGLANTNSDPSRVLGWIVYVGIESYGSICVALFWSFVASSTSSASAKKGYPLIITGGQIGSIFGPSIATMTEIFSIPNLFTFAVFQIMLIITLTRYYMVGIGIEEMLANIDDSTVKKKTPGLLVGIKLLTTQKYLMGIFAVSTIYEVVGSIMDYQMKMLAKETYSSTEAYTAFLASFGVAVNSLSFCIALVGTSYLLRKFGLRACLLIYPSAVGIVLVCVFLVPTLTVVFFAQVCVKGLSYAINNPSKEMLYIPTSPDVKFKVKSWIDMFGSRSAKALGAVVVNPLKGSLDTLLHTGTLISFVWVFVWLFTAVFVGKEWNILTLENDIKNISASEPNSNSLTKVVTLSENSDNNKEAKDLESDNHE